MAFCHAFLGMRIRPLTFIEAARVLCLQLTGQPVLIGGTMGTCRLVLAVRSRDNRCMITKTLS